MNKTPFLFTGPFAFIIFTAVGLVGAVLLLRLFVWFFLTEDKARWRRRRPRGRRYRFDDGRNTPR